MNQNTAPIPYADASIDDAGRELLERPLPDSLEALRRYHDGDDAFPPPHWVRLRAAHDATLGARLIEAWRALQPLVTRATGDASLAEAWAELRLDAADPHVQAFALAALERGAPPEAEPMLFDAAAAGIGPRFDALFARDAAPLDAHLHRLTALREKGGMPWSEAFAKTVLDGLASLAPRVADWTLRLIAELGDPRARRFLERALGVLDDQRQRDAVVRFLSHPPSPDPEPELEPLPSSFEALELGAIDPRRPARQVAYLGHMAGLDWPRARRLASSITTDDWRLDELVGALLNHPSHALMVEDFVARGLLAAPIVPPVDSPSARELLREGGKVVRFDTTSTEGLVDHDALAYLLAEAAGDALTGVDFLEVYLPDRSLWLDAWDGARHFRVELDTRRSVVDPYGLVGLLNVLLRERGRPERFLLAAEDRGIADVVVGPEIALRGLVDAGLLWIRSSFKW